MQYEVFSLCPNSMGVFPISASTHLNYPRKTGKNSCTNCSDGEIKHKQRLGLGLLQLSNGHQKHLPKQMPLTNYIYLSDQMWPQKPNGYIHLNPVNRTLKRFYLPTEVKY